MAADPGGRRERVITFVMSECGCAAGVLLCFAGLLGASEAVALDDPTWALAATICAALPGRTKRGAQLK
eukprot:7475215-Pyramimonas_sp.AAC.1